MSAAGRVVCLVVAATVALSCRHAPPQAAPPPPAAPPAEGQSKYTFLFDPANPALSLPADTRFDRPRPIDTKTLPVYPARALADRFGPHREVVRIVIDKDGKVAEVHDSPLGASDKDAYSEEFRRSVDAAVRTWTFTPGSLRKVEPGTDLDGDGKPDYVITKSWERVAVYDDVRFTFEIVEGQGVVRREP